MMTSISTPNFTKANQNVFSDSEKELFRNMRLVILMPIAERAEAKTMKAVSDMIAYSWHKGLRVFEMGMTERTVVDWARNQLAREALQREDPLEGKLYTHFLWVDSDMVFEPDMACQLARYNVDMVSVVYYCRSGPALPLIYVKLEDDKLKSNPNYKYMMNPLLDIPPVLCEVDAFGFGSCLISRKVFERTPEPWFTIDYRAGEDIAFCVKVKEHGFKIMCDGAYIVGHQGLPQVVGKNDHNRWKLENQEAYLRDRVKVNLGGK
jgi:hypothetical protein